jgi:acid stress chaperone HdeB
MSGQSFTPTPRLPSLSPGPQAGAFPCGARYDAQFSKSVEGFMRVNLVLFGLAITLLSTSLALGQVSIDVSKITCDQFAQGKVGLPRTTAIWLNGYYHGKIGSTTIDTEQSEAIFGVLMDYCRTGENGKLLVMQALERLMKPK